MTHTRSLGTLQRGTSATSQGRLFRLPPPPQEQNLRDIFDTPFDPRGTGAFDLGGAPSEATSLGPFTGRNVTPRATIDTPVVDVPAPRDVTESFDRPIDKVEEQRSFARFLAFSGETFSPQLFAQFQAGAAQGFSPQELSRLHQAGLPFQISGDIKPGSTFSIQGLGPEEELARRERALGAGQRDSQERLTAAFSDIDREQGAIFAPRFSAAEREADRARETSTRGFAFRGFGKSTRSIEEEERINEIAGREQAALAAEQSAAIRLQRALARGASGEEIAGLQAQVDSQRAVVEGLAQQRAVFEAEASAAQIEAGAAAESDRITQRIAALKAQGLTEDPDTGERIETMEARKVALDEEVRLGGLDIDKGEFAIKAAKAPFEIAKLELDVQSKLDKLNRATGPGTDINSLTEKFLSDSARVRLAAEALDRIDKGEAVDISDAIGLIDIGTGQKEDIANDAALLFTYINQQQLANPDKDIVLSLDTGTVNIVPKAVAPPTGASIGSLNTDISAAPKRFGINPIENDKTELEKFFK